MEIKDLDPIIVWKNFYALTRIPRPSKREGKVSEYLYNWGKSHGFDTTRDEIGNVIIRKAATPGMENRKGVIFQAHMDMVPQKNADTTHDFDTDPIEAYQDGDWVWAKGTTLGADDGVGVAMALSVLESDNLKHGPVEVLVTVDEETGMEGAHALKSGLLEGELLINLDSETEGELYVGCAGGLDATAYAEYTPQEVPAGYETYSLSAKGFRGGHSGIEIILCRGNAIKLAARVLYALMKKAGVKLVDFKGGTLRNAIPREAFATVCVPTDKVDCAKKVFEEVSAIICAEYSGTDPNAKFSFEPCTDAKTSCVDEANALKYIETVIACPDGVERMSAEVPGLVETSNNLAMVKIEDGEFSVKTLMRSSVNTAKAALAERFTCIFDLAGIETKFEGGYNGWAPNNASAILHTMKDVYANLFGKAPEVMAIHAGLECGILGEAYPHWDMISCGPTIVSPHSPDEHVSISSVAKCWKFLQAVLENIPEK